MSLDSKSPAYRLMQEDRETYEQYVLAALNYNEKLWGQMCPYLCVDARTGRNINDFEYSMHYGLYLALKMHRQLMSEGKQEFTTASEAGINACLYMLALEPRPVVVEEQLDEYMQLWRDIMQHATSADALAVVTPTWQVWLQNKKAQHLAKHLAITDGEQSKTHIETLARVQQNIAAATNEQTFETFFTLQESSNLQEVERFPMSPRTWGVFNESLGGGFGRKEHALGVAPSGGGKTVMACQIAGEMAYAGRNVLFVSTEEPFDRIAPRFISCLSFNSNPDTSIPYRLVKGKPNFESYLTGKRLAMFKEIRKKLGPRLIYANWTGHIANEAVARKYDITDLNAEVERAIKHFEARGERLDIVILDWLGAALGDGSTDQSSLTIIYNKAASRMKDISIEYDVAAISFAQASNDAAKKAKIDQTSIANSKSLHHEAHVAFGISHLAAAADEGGGTRQSFKEQQCFNVFKSRGGVPQSFWMRENFDFMRFDSL